MLKSATYRTIAALLCITILFGFSFPSELHAGPDQVCDLMTTTHDDHGALMSSSMDHENCPMADMADAGHSHHSNGSDTESQHSGINCACSIDNISVETEARVLQKTKTLVLSVLSVFNAYNTITDETAENAIQRLDSYSSPPIFLVNESFLI